CVSAGTLAKVANQQPAGEVVARSATKNAGGGSFPRWEVGANAGGSTAASCSWYEVGHAPLSGHEPSRRSERSSMISRAKTFDSPSGEPSTTRPCHSTNVRKTLDTTLPGYRI